MNDDHDALPDSAMTSGTEPVLAYRQRRRVKLGGSGCAAFVLGIVGLILVFSPLFLFGIALLVVAFLVDGKTGHVFFCGACGNTVPPTAMLCQTCRAELVPMPSRAGKDAAIWAVCLLSLGLLVWVGKSMMDWQKVNLDDAAKPLPESAETAKPDPLAGFQEAAVSTLKKSRPEAVVMKVQPEVLQDGTRVLLTFMQAGEEHVWRFTWQGQKLVEIYSDREGDIFPPRP